MTPLRGLATSWRQLLGPPRPPGGPAGLSALLPCPVPAPPPSRLFWPLNARQLGGRCAEGVVELTDCVVAMPALPALATPSGLRTSRPTTARTRRRSRIRTTTRARRTATPPQTQRCSWRSRRQRSRRNTRCCTGRCWWGWRRAPCCARARRCRPSGALLSRLRAAATTRRLLTAPWLGRATSACAWTTPR